MRSLERIIALMFVHLHFSADLSYGWTVQCSEHLDTKAYPPTPSHLFRVPPGREVGVWMCKLSEELNANNDK